MYFFHQMEWLGNATFETLRVHVWGEYLEDVEYLRWVIWLVTPIIMAFLLPMVFIGLLYVSAITVHIYRHRYGIKDAYARDAWDGARYIVAAIWDAHGWLWFGYEVVGMENIPDNGPALIVYYHGATPIDYYYLLSKTLLKKNRVIRSVGDRFLFKVPGWKLLMDVFFVFPGTVQGCAQTLKDGHLLSIAPGGVREAQFGDETYRLLWGSRLGFAKVALEAKVPIVPFFTTNIREAFRSLSLFRGVFHRIYVLLKLPVVPIYGGFPVKLRTYVGEPIPYDANLTPEQLAEKTASAIEDLISKHQRVPGNILAALIDRFRSPSKPKNK